MFNDLKENRSMTKEEPTGWWRVERRSRFDSSHSIVRAWSAAGAYRRTGLDPREYEARPCNSKGEVPAR